MMTIDEAENIVAEIVKEALRISDQAEHMEIMEVEGQLYINGEFYSDTGEEIYASLIVELI